MFRIPNNRRDERWGLWAAASILGSALGTLFYLGMSGFAANTGIAPVSWAGWVWFLTMRSLFFAITTVPLARVGWAINILTAVAIVATPLGGPGTLRWAMRMALLIGAAGLIVLATGRAVRAWQPRAIAGAVIVVVAVAQLYALASFDQVEGRESVMSGW